MAEEEVKKEAEKSAEADAAETSAEPEATVESESTDAAGDAEKPEKLAEPEKPAEPDWKDLYARLRADFDNYKKRAARDRDDVYRFAESDILTDVIPSVDNLQLALSKAENAEDAFVKGVKLVLDGLLKALKDHGAEPFESVGKELDTERMEAIASLPSDDVDEGKVSNEVKKGWMLRDKVLRAAQVVVSAGKKENG